MNVDVEIVGQSTAHAYLTWTPYQGRLTPQNFAGATISVQLKSGGSGTGRVVFSKTPNGPYSKELSVSVASGTATNFFVAGHFPNASNRDGDVSIECTNSATGTLLGKCSATVRIRRNANAFSTAERDKFIAAMAQLNNQGLGLFQAFRETHTAIADPEAHQNYGFLSWHRCYLLDLERALQAIDPFVTLPYWRFDQAAPNLFSADFLGVPFAPSNPLSNWATDGTIPLVVRTPLFNTATQPASGVPGFPVINETTTIGLGTQFLAFKSMEGSPHGAAHVSFNGFIDNPATAPKDPLFFLLHCNVDRLWAKWQWLNKRFDKSKTASYPAQGAAGTIGARRVGHNLLDTMWPWNGVITSPRPGSAPRTPFPASSLFASPSANPTVGQMIDFQGNVTPGDRLGFDYDDVPFDPTVV